MKIVFLSVTCLGLAVEGMTPEILAPALRVDWEKYNKRCRGSETSDEWCKNAESTWTSRLRPLGQEYVAGLVFGDKCLLVTMPTKDQIELILEGIKSLDDGCFFSRKKRDASNTGGVDSPLLK
jgi:hypothetical protein